MSRGYWLPILAVIGLATSANAQGVSHDFRGGRVAQHNQGKPKTDAQPAIPVAVQNDIHGIVTELHAANQKQKSAEENDRDKRNLVSQEKMAKWGGRMFGIGLLETLVTLAGVILVALTLRHTKRAADAARDTVNSMEDTAKRQLRAYVVVNEVERDGAHVWPPEFVLTIKNAGQTPAHKLSVRTGEIVAKSEPDIGDFKIQAEGQYEIPLGPGHSSEHRFLHEDLEGVCTGVSGKDFTMGKGPNLYIAGVIDYQDIYGVWHVTKFHFAYANTDVEDGNVTFCQKGNEAT